MECTHSAAEMRVATPEVTRTRSRFPFGTLGMGIVLILSALIPLDAVWLSHGNGFLFTGSIDSHGIKWNYEGAPHLALYLLAPLANLLSGLVLAFYHLPKIELWRPLRRFHLALFIVVGEGLLLVTMLRLKMPGLQAPFDYAAAFALSAAEGLWFHGLLMEGLKRRPVFAVTLSSVLLALWHVSFVYRPLGVGLDTDFGVEKAIVIAFAAVPFGIARCRGASVLSLVLANFFLSVLLGDSQLDAKTFQFHVFHEPLAVCAGYVCLNVLLLTLPVPTRPLEGVRYRYPLIPGALVVMTGVAPFFKTKEPSRAASPATREEKWAADLRILASVYPGRHIDFTKRGSVRAFRERCYQLGAKASQLSDLELILETRRLIADLHVDHSNVIHPWKDFYPIGFGWASDGLLVGPVDHPAADPKTKTLRVLRMGELSPEQVTERVAPFISHENENWLRQQSTELMASPAMMQQLGVAAPDRTLTLRRADAAGEEHELKFTPASPSSPAVPAPRRGLISSISPELLATAKGYWGGVIQETPNTLYLRFDHDPGKEGNPFGSFGDFVNAMLRLAESHSATQIIVDLRGNTGGAFHAIAPLLHALKKRPQIAAGGRTRVLIGSKTFSAAVAYAVALKKEFGAVLIGEPTGGGLTIYGDPVGLRLPNTGLVVTYPRRKVSAGLGARGPLVPDMSVRRSSYSEFCRGYDPQLAAAVDLPL